MNQISRNITTIYRTESLIARRRLAVIQSQTVMVALAGVVALIGLILLNACLYLLLADWLSPAGATGALAAANLGLAVVLASRASRLSVDQEIAPAVEMRDMAISELEAEIGDVGTDVRKIVRTLAATPRDPFGSLLTLVVPILTALLSKKS